MDWEKKFTSILNESKANLSKVKNRYDSSGLKNVTWAPKYYSTPMKRSSSLHELPQISSTMYNQTFPSDYYNGASTSSFMPYPSTQTLMEKIEKQNTDIEHLRGTVHRLETDRHNYKEQIRDLRNEIYQLTDKTCDRRPDPSSERRIEQIRRELLGEIQLLQSQLQISSAKGNNSHLSDAQLLAMNRDVLEIKHAFRDELEGFRRDIEILRSRIAKIELELASMLSGKREVERRQDTLDRTINTLSMSQRNSHVPPSAVAMMNTNRQLEKMQINELRTTLSALKDKIDFLERTSSPISTSTKLSSPKRPVLTNAKPISLRTYDSDLLDEIDLSDDASSQSSDFTEFDPGINKDVTMKQNKNTGDGFDSDDLDMDDLDLSDDDLSQNSLDDLALENGDLS